MKKTVFFIAMIILTLATYSCDQVDREAIEAKAEYYYHQGEMYSTLMLIGSDSPQTRSEMRRLMQEEQNYISSLSAEERDIYYNKVNQLGR